MALKVQDLKGRKLGICVSGGLDSKTISMRLREAGADVLCFTADLGQPDEKDINDVVKKMAPCGVETVVVDVRKPMAEACFKTVMAEATYDGGYWNSTGIGRAVTTVEIIKAMKARGIDTLVHGATGRGNDQMRFERYTNQFAPEMEVYAPWRDATLLQEFPGRTQMCEYLAKHGIVAFPGGKKRYSTDGNIAGLSHEAEDLESMQTAMTIVETTMGVWPMTAPDAIESVSFTFEKGRAVAVNGKAMEPFDLLVEANRVGGRNGIGLSHALENRIIGTYPAMYPAFEDVEGDIQLAVLERGVKMTGATAYFADSDGRVGGVIMQKAIEVKPNDDPETLRRRVLEEGEWKILPQSVALYCQGKLSVRGKRVVIEE